jgi:hypothetical protein
MVPWKERVVRLLRVVAMVGAVASLMAAVLALIRGDVTSATASVALAVGLVNGVCIDALSARSGR